MRLFLHDATPAKPGERHGEDGPTHVGTEFGDCSHDYGDDR